MNDTAEHVIACINFQSREPKAHVIKVGKNGGCYLGCSGRHAWMPLPVNLFPTATLCSLCVKKFNLPND